MIRLFTFLLLIVSILACSEEKIHPQIDSTGVAGEIPSNESWNSKITFTNDGLVKAVLFADHLKMFEKQRVTLLDNIKIDFYDSSQKATTMLTALRGKVDDVTQNMYAIDSVVARNDSGVVLNTSQLMWRNSDQKIVTDKFVKITSPKEIIEGYGLESDQRLSNYTIFNITYSTTINNKKK
jgi:LPS export ABC transporter protein LptC